MLIAFIKLHCFKLGKSKEGNFFSCYEFWKIGWAGQKTDFWKRQKNRIWATEDECRKIETVNNS